MTNRQLRKLQDMFNADGTHIRVIGRDEARPEGGP